MCGCGVARRLFGTQLAEMPFVATRQGYRRAGHCRRLVKVSVSDPSCAYAVECTHCTAAAALLLPCMILR
jgi:hypothetical protein